jgi:MoaA/NifB/PqqE/SkfB family radical SAM enzyme
MASRLGHQTVAAATTPGVKLIFELTNRCNFSCLHCIRAEDGPKHF